MRSRNNGSAGTLKGIDTELATESEVVVENEDIKLLRSTTRRILAFGIVTFKSILLSTDELPDVAFEMAPDVLKTDEIYFMGIFRRVCFLGVFLYFAQNVFMGDYKFQPNMAVDQSTNQYCSNVSRSWSLPSILADYGGNWEGQLDFQINKAIYSFSFSNFTADDIFYSAWLTKVQRAVEKVGARAKKQDLALNLVYWGSWLHEEPTIASEGVLNSQSLTLTGDPRYIMNSDYTQSTIANVEGDCPFNYSSSSYYLPTGDLTMSYDLPTISRVSACNNIINPALLGYNPNFDGTTLTFTINVYTLFSTMVVANLVNGPDSLKAYVTIDVYAEFMFRGVDYQVMRKYDNMYPTMPPMYCLGPKGSNATEWNCLIKIGDTFGIPFYLHAGPSPSFPSKCDCATTVGNTAACNQFNFLSGVIVHDYTNNASATREYQANIRPFLPALEFFYVPPVYSASIANQLAYYPAWAAMLGQGNQQYSDPLWRENAYQFSHTTSFGYGSLIVFQSFTARDWTISKDKYQLRFGACADTFLTPNFERFYSNTWGKLTEPYFQCTWTFAYSLQDAAGIASGFAQLIVPTGTIIVMFTYISLVAYGNTDYYIRRIKAAELGTDVDDEAVNTRVGPPRPGAMLPPGESPWEKPVLAFMESLLVMVFVLAVVIVSFSFTIRQVMSGASEEPGSTLFSLDIGVLIFFFVEFIVRAHCAIYMRDTPCEFFTNLFNMTDMLVILIDFAFLMLPSKLKIPGGGAVKGLRLIRFMRLTRLLRAVRVGVQLRNEVVRREANRLDMIHEATFGKNSRPGGNTDPGSVGSKLRPNSAAAAGGASGLAARKSFGEFYQERKKQLLADHSVSQLNEADISTIVISEYHYHMERTPVNMSHSDPTQQSQSSTAVLPNAIRQS